MARILYAVQGEGMGHATRSKVVIEHLKKQKHKVIIAAGGKAYKFLSKNFSNVHNISSHHIVYENNEVKNIKTAFEYFRNLPSAVINNFKQLLKILLIFEPELVITDFEPFSNFISNRFKIPVLAIDNISIILKGSIKVPANEIFSFLTAAMVTQAFVRINADKYIITTFFYPKVKKPDNTILVPPALRNEILNAKQKKGNHILVYQTSITNKELLKTMKKVNEKFIIYGFDKEKTDKNLVFRKFSEKKFINDLASCKALIVNGGFTVISEAIYLGKPILSIPVKHQFEQCLNAIYVEKLGYGEKHEHATAEIIKNFIAKIPEYAKNLKSYKQQGNKILFSEVDKSIKELLKRKKSRK